MLTRDTDSEEGSVNEGTNRVVSRRSWILVAIVGCLACGFTVGVYSGSNLSGAVNLQTPKATKPAGTTAVEPAGTINAPTGDCDCMPEWTYPKTDGKTYKGCAAEGTANKGQPWCYVNGGKKCNQGQDSLDLSEKKKWRNCSPCNCVVSAKYQDQEAGGCSKAGVGDKGQSWCYVEGGESCKQAQPSTLPGEKKLFRSCDPCNCRLDWNFKNVLYTGCEMATFKYTWCYVQGVGDQCAAKDLKKSSEDGEIKKWKPCDTCSCKDSWNYKEKTYKACEEASKTNTNFGYTWCYVQGGKNCKGSKKSDEDDEENQWKQCDAEAPTSAPAPPP